MVKVGDIVRHRDNPNSVPCYVEEVTDLGHGEGFERVKICLFDCFVRYYAANELVVVEKKKSEL